MLLKWTFCSAVFYRLRSELKFPRLVTPLNYYNISNSIMQSAIFRKVNFLQRRSRIRVNHVVTVASMAEGRSSSGQIHS